MHGKKSELQATFWSENLKGRGHVEEVGISWKILFNRLLGKRIGSDKVR
jgi:hypothetical protein